MLYSKGGIYHAIYQWYIAMCTVVYTLLYNTALLLCYKLFNTAPVLCYKLFNTAHCYVTSYLTLLYNMSIHTFWTARALPACLATPPRALDVPRLLSSIYSPPDKPEATVSSSSPSTSPTPSAPPVPSSGSLRWARSEETSSSLKAVAKRVSSLFIRRLVVGCCTKA